MAGIPVILPASIARGVPTTIQSEILLEFLEAAHGAVVFDVGANVGVWSAMALGRGARHVVAIEPSPACVEILRELAALHPSRMTVVAAAVGSENGKAHLAMVAPLAATNRLAASGLEVPMARIDCIAQSVGRIPDVVKLDVEGAETAALIGMAGLPCWPLTLAELHWDGTTPEALLATGHGLTTVTGTPVMEPSALIRINAVRVY